MTNPLLQIWSKLTPKAQKFYKDFWETKSGHRFIDSENFKFRLILFDEIDASHLGMLWKRSFDPAIIQS